MFLYKNCNLQFEGYVLSISKRLYVELNVIDYFVFQNIIEIDETDSTFA